MVLPAIRGPESNIVEVRDDESWDALVDAAPQAEIFHTTAWLQLVSNVFGMRMTRLGLLQDGALVAGLPILTSKRGPFVLAGSPIPGASTPQLGPIALDDTAIPVLFDAFDRFQRQSRVAVAEIIATATFDAGQLERSGYTLMPHRTLAVHMAGRTADEIWKDFSGRVRTHIRKATKQNVHIEVPSDPSFVADYLPMVKAVFAKHDRPVPFPDEYYSALWSHLHPRGMLRVLLARHEGNIVAGGFFLFHNHRLYYLDGASYPHYYHLRANHLVQWTIMQWAVEQGAHVYDMVGADAPGLTQFKSSFGAQFVPLIRARRENSRLAKAALSTYLRVRPLARSLAFRLRGTSAGTTSNTEDNA